MARGRIEEERRRADRTAFRALASDPPAQRAAALRTIAHSSDEPLLIEALAVASRRGDPECRRAMRTRYDAIDASGGKGDGLGTIRGAIVAALRPMIQPDDRPLLLRALTSYGTVGMYEVLGALRSAGLVAMNDLEPETAAAFAGRFLVDPATAFTNEAGLTAVGVLAAQQRWDVLFALVSWREARIEVLDAALRALVDLPSDLVELLIPLYRDDPEEQLLLGLADLLIAHPASARWSSTLTGIINRGSLPLAEAIATQIVASRDPVLIDALGALQTRILDRRKSAIIEAALRFL